jgi:hypothetical protein
LLSNLAPDLLLRFCPFIPLNPPILADSEGKEYQSTCAKQLPFTGIEGANPKPSELKKSHDHST